jgi:hypothetical protein
VMRTSPSWRTCNGNSRDSLLEWPARHYPCLTLRPRCWSISRLTHATVRTVQKSQWNTVFEIVFLAPRRSSAAVGKREPNFFPFLGPLARGSGGSIRRHAKTRWRAFSPGMELWHMHPCSCSGCAAFLGPSIHSPRPRNEARRNQPLDRQYRSKISIAASPPSTLPTIQNSTSQHTLQSVRELAPDAGFIVSCRGYWCRFCKAGHGTGALIKSRRAQLQT